MQFMEEMSFETNFFLSSPAMWPFIFQSCLKNGRTTIILPESLEMNLCA